MQEKGGVKKPGESPWVLEWWRSTEFDLPGSARGSACCCSGSRNRPISKPGLGQGWRTRLALPAQDLDEPVRLKNQTRWGHWGTGLFFPKVKPI